MLDKLSELNENFYILYGRLYNNLELITEKQYSFIADKLYEQYKTEYVKLSVAKEIEDKTEIYTLKQRYKGYVPRGLIFKNKAKKLLDEEIKQELLDFYKKKRQELDEAPDVENTNNENVDGNVNE